VHIFVIPCSFFSLILFTTHPPHPQPWELYLAGLGTLLSIWSFFFGFVCLMIGKPIQPSSFAHSEPPPSVGGAEFWLLLLIIVFWGFIVMVDFAWLQLRGGHEVVEFDSYENEKYFVHM
jgi:hypothetical protein